MRRELEHHIQGESSRYSSEIIIILKGSLSSQIVPFRKNLLRRLAKEHLPTTESMKKQVEIDNLGRRVIRNTWAEESKWVEEPTWENLWNMPSSRQACITPHGISFEEFSSAKHRITPF